MFQPIFSRLIVALHLVDNLRGSQQWGRNRIRPLWQDSSGHKNEHNCQKQDSISGKEHKA
jgi:hypothetical protein